MVNWEFSRNQMCHHGFTIQRTEDDVIEVYMHIRPTNRAINIYNKVRMKDGYDLFEGEMGTEDRLLKHAKTVKLLKEFAEEYYADYS